MFEGILKAFKKKLETKEELEKAPLIDGTPVLESDEFAEFDILSYVEKHGVEDKDSVDTTKKSDHKYSQIRIKKKKKHQESKIESDLSDFVEESQLEEKSDGCDEILDYVKRFGVYNKDGSGDKSKKSSSDGSVYKNKRAMEKRIDLHGMTADEADQYLRRVIDEARAVGVTQLLVVHGRGMHSRSNGGADVLRQRVRQLLSREYSHLVESFKFAPGSDGGDGATRVFLK